MLTIYIMYFTVKAKMASPAIIFFDEIDALAVEREGNANWNYNRLWFQGSLTQLTGEIYRNFPKSKL